MNNISYKVVIIELQHTINGIYKILKTPVEVRSNGIWCIFLAQKNLQD